ncbi:Nickel and cobalt resistance protein CnrA [compost metagenome]
MDPNSAALHSARERLRPILLTAFTTITGLLPMAIGLTIDFFDRDAFFGAPSGQFWVQLSTTIVGGLIVGTVITSCLTPTLLAWDGRHGNAGRLARRPTEDGASAHFCPSHSDPPSAACPCSEPDAQPEDIRLTRLSYSRCFPCAERRWSRRRKL